jgi:hypothetical protein
MLLRTCPTNYPRPSLSKIETVGLNLLVVDFPNSHGAPFPQ